MADKKMVTNDTLTSFFSKLVSDILSKFVTKEDGKGLSTNDYDATAKNAVDNLSTNYVAKDGNKQLSTEDFTSEFKTQLEGLDEKLSSEYVAKDGEKVLSTNDFTTEYKTQLDTLKTTVDGTKISGVIPLASIPQGALERLVPVDNEEAMLKLTKEQVQIGDVVQLTDTKAMYYVKSEEALSSDGTTAATKSEAFTEFTAGKAASVAWSGITDIPFMTEEDVDTMMGINQ